MSHERQRAQRQVLEADPIRLSLFEAPIDCMPCHCGRGWCELHGTHHYDDTLEAFEEDLRVIRRSTAGGRRVIRKEIGGDNY